MPRKLFNGFTLAELLISLAILGVIATFTIPKILSAQTISTNNSILKEAAGMISGAYDTYRQRNTVTASTGVGTLTPYLNYVKVDSTATVDDQQGHDTDCSDTANNSCIRMHNGSMLVWYPDDSFGGTQSYNVVHACVDPDGIANADTINDPGAGICFLLYYDGRLLTRDLALSSSISGKWGGFGPGSGFDPAWFTW